MHVGSTATPEKILPVTRKESSQTLVNHRTAFTYHNRFDDRNAFSWVGILVAPFEALPGLALVDEEVRDAGQLLREAPHEVGERVGQQRDAGEHDVVGGGRRGDVRRDQHEALHLLAASQHLVEARLHVEVDQLELLEGLEARHALQDAQDRAARQVALLQT